MVGDIENKAAKKDFPAIVVRGFSRLNVNVEKVKKAGAFEKAGAAVNALESAAELVGNLCLFCIDLQKQIDELKK